MAPDRDRIERCPGCSFDGARWTDADAVNTLRAAEPLVVGVVEELPPELALVRPAPERWSIAEYVDHLREVLFGMRFLVDTALDAPGTDLGPAPESVFTEAPREIDLDAAVEAFGLEAAALFRRLVELTPHEWDATVVFGGDEVDIHWIARHAVHDLTHHLRDIGRNRHELGAGVPPDRGSVAQLNVSDGGVPKQPVEALDVEWNGPVGDRQNDRQNHGRPFQALCLWSVEVIDALAADGHPIAPGAAGENVTIRGLDWARLRPGAILAIGGVRAEISAYAVPCKKNAGWFSDRDFNRIHHDRLPGGSRLYATVLVPGRITVGDEVVVEPVP